MKSFQKYAADGYFVSREAIPMVLVEQLARVFRQDVKTNVEPMLRQNCRYETNSFDENGFITSALLDPHLSPNPRLGGLRDAILELACSEQMLAALAQITLQPSHSLQQIMMFEQSVTSAHQDWVYLDTSPPGYLTAAWVALEDIDPAAARFFVVPGSQDFDERFPQDVVLTSSKYMETMQAILKERFSDRIVVPPMRAGDVLFWSSRLIHGSLPGSDPTKSRLSLTAHYVPKGFGYGSRYTPQNYPFAVSEQWPIAYRTGE